MDYYELKRNLLEAEWMERNRVYLRNRNARRRAYIACVVGNVAAWCVMVAAIGYILIPAFIEVVMR